MKRKNFKRKGRFSKRIKRNSAGKFHRRSKSKRIPTVTLSRGGIRL